MSTSEKQTASHRRGGILLDSCLGCFLGPFIETGEHIPCMALNGLLLRVEIVGDYHVLFAWNENTEVWDVVAQTRNIFRLSTVVPLLADYMYIRSLADQV